MADKWLVGLLDLRKYASSFNMTLDNVDTQLDDLYLLLLSTRTLVLEIFPIRFRSPIH